MLPTMRTNCTQKRKHTHTRFEEVGLSLELARLADDAIDLMRECKSNKTRHNFKPLRHSISKHSRVYIVSHNTRTYTHTHQRVRTNAHGGSCVEASASVIYEVICQSCSCRALYLAHRVQTLTCTFRIHSGAKALHAQRTNTHIS